MPKKTEAKEAPPQAAAAKPFEPNVILAGRGKPLGKGPVTVGMDTIGNLPDEETQRAGFYFKNANLLIQLYPNHFKRLSAKG